MNGLPPGVLSKSSGQSGMGENSHTYQQTADGISNIGYAVSNPKSEIGYNAMSYSDSDECMPPIQWVFSMLLYMMPIVNIFYIVFTIIKGDTEEKRNWAKGAVFALIVSYLAWIIAFIVLKNITIMQLFDTYAELKGL